MESFLTMLILSLSAFLAMVPSQSATAQERAAAPFIAQPVMRPPMNTAAFGMYVDGIIGDWCWPARAAGLLSLYYTRGPKCAKRNLVRAPLESSEGNKQTPHHVHCENPRAVTHNRGRTHVCGSHRTPKTAAEELAQAVTSLKLWMAVGSKRS